MTQGRYAVRPTVDAVQYDAANATETENWLVARGVGFQFDETESGTEITAFANTGSWRLKTGAWFMHDGVNLWALGNARFQTLAVEVGNDPDVTHSQF